MNNSMIAAKHEDPDPISALYMGIWYALVSIIGIPLNIFIVIATFYVQKIRSVPANAFIGSLAVSDALLLLCFGLHLLYALTFDETLCKVLGFGISMLAMLGSYIPPLLALNRYVVVYSEENKLSRYLNGVFSRKGAYSIVLLLWIFEFIHELPYVMLGTLGLHAFGVCTTVNKYSRTLFVRIYYYFGAIGIVSITNLPLLIFYRKVSLWVKRMSLKFSLSNNVKETIYETQSTLRLTKWVTLIPIVFTSLPVLLAIVLEFNSEIVSMRYCRLIISLYPCIPLLNAIVTLKFARPYRKALKKVCERSSFTRMLFSWIIERQLNNRVDALPTTNSFMTA